MGILDDIQTTTEDIPIDSIELAREQVRQEKVGEGLEELAANIDRVGLLYPVVVARLGKGGDRWELIAGQRRFLAIKNFLKWNSIRALCIDQELDDLQALTISASENFLQQRMTSNDWKATCNRLWDIFGQWSKIHAETGLPIPLIKKYVKGARLAPELKELEQEGYSTDLLIKAQDHTEEKGIPNPARAVELIKSLMPLDDAARTRSMAIAKNNPNLEIAKVIEEAEKPPPATVTAKVTFEGGEADRLTRFAEEENATVNETVRNIVTDFLNDSTEDE